MITDLGLYPRPPLPDPPAKGQPYVDPVFKQRVLRVTDESDGWSNGTAYGYWPTFSKASTLLLVQSADQAGDTTPLRFLFDAKTFTAQKIGPVFTQDSPTGALQAEDLIWAHRVDAALIGHTNGGLDVYRFNVLTRRYTKLIDLAAVLPSLKGLALDQASLSLDDRIYAAALKDASYTKVGFVVVDLSARTVVLHVATDASFDEVQVDKSGKWLVYKTGTAGRVYDLATGQAIALTDGAPDFMMGHSDNGGGYCIGFENFSGTLLWRALADPHVTRLVFDAKTIQGGHWPSDQHISLLANDATWFAAGYYQDRLPIVDRPCDNEILLIASDGSGQVQRLCHHRGGGSPEYLDAPRPNRSRNGRWIAYTSSWELTLGEGRRDLFIVDTKAA